MTLQDDDQPTQTSHGIFEVLGKFVLCEAYVDHLIGKYLSGVPAGIRAEVLKRRYSTDERGRVLRAAIEAEGLGAGYPDLYVLWSEISDRRNTLAHSVITTNPDGSVVLTQPAPR